VTTRRYASETTVPPDRSRAEIERVLERYGAARFLYGWEPGHALISFEMRGRRMRFVLPLPDESEFRFTPRLQLRSDGAWREAHQQALRQRWRALALIIKAKLEAIESGIVTFEAEFLAQTVLPQDNQTVADWLVPQIEEAYRSGRLPDLLPGASQRQTLYLPAPEETA